MHKRAFLVRKLPELQGIVPTVQQTGSIETAQYIISQNPRIAIVIFKGYFEGLVRADVQFGSATEAQAFAIPDYCGAEITGTLLEKDSDIALLKRKELDFLLYKYLTKHQVIS